MFLIHILVEARIRFVLNAEFLLDGLFDGCNVVPVVEIGHCERVKWLMTTGVSPRLRITLTENSRWIDNARRLVLVRPSQVRQNTCGVLAK
jgi:hypothetical protein